jgi:hypothetical protein
MTEMGAKPNSWFCAHWQFGMTQSGRKLPVRFGEELLQ